MASTRISGCLPSRRVKLIVPARPARDFCGDFRLASARRAPEARRPMPLGDPGGSCKRGASGAEAKMAFRLIDRAAEFAPKLRLQGLATAKIIQRLAIPSK